MGMFSKNDPYEEDRLARIEKIGQEAYDKEHAEWLKSIPPIKWSKSEPQVTVNDIIGIWDKQKQVIIDEAHVKEITDEGEIIVWYLDNRNDGRPEKWEGEYVKVCSVREEY